MDWALDDQGRLPGEIGNFNTISSSLLKSLKPVNVKSISSNAVKTTKVDIGANLKSSEAALKGASSKISFPVNSKNYNIDSKNLIVPDNAAGINFDKGDRLILSPSSEVSINNYKASKSINSTSLVAGAGDITSVFTGNYATSGNSVNNGDQFTISTVLNGVSTTDTFTFKGTSPSSSNGEFNSLTTLVNAINNRPNLTASIVDNRLYVANKDANAKINFTNVGSTAKFVDDLGFFDAAAPKQAFQFEYGGFAESKSINTNIVAGANSEKAIFGGTYKVSGGAVNNGDKFKIKTNVAGTEVEYTFNLSSPLVSDGQFNNLTSMAEAINQSSGLSARIVDGKLYIANQDANNAITFIDVNSAKFVEDLGLANINAAAGNTQRYATLQDLSNKISEQSGLKASVSSSINGSSVEFYTTDPQGTLTINAAKALSNDGTAEGILKQLGIEKSLGSVMPSSYVANDSSRNMANRQVAAHLSRNIRVYDALGTGHDLQLAFAKLKENTWAVEIYSLNKNEIVTSRDDSQIASGQIEFNGDGTLRRVSPSLSKPASIAWSNGSVSSDITFNFGTAGDISGTVGSAQIGKADGLRQLDTDHQVDIVNQNGISASSRSGIEIDKDGYIIAKFSNGTSRKISQTPVADFANPNGLEARPGNVYAETSESGAVNLKRASTLGAGKIAPGTLEQANVELSDELTRMIIAQRGYQANSTVIKTVNDMLAELKSIA